MGRVALSVVSIFFLDLASSALSTMSHSRVKRFSLTEILVLAGTTGAGRMTPPASTTIPARITNICAQEHSSPVNNVMRGSLHGRYLESSSSIVFNDV